VVFLAFLLASYWNWHTVNLSVDKEREQLIAQKVTNTEKSITQRLQTYEEILRSGVSLFNASRSVEADEWRRYVDTFDIPQRYPGILGIGYIEQVYAENVPAFLEKARELDNNPSFRIHPEGERPIYAALLYIKALQGGNVSSLQGFDMYTDPLRKTAMEHARDTGQVVMSPKINFLPNTATDVSSGFLMIMPVYAQGASLTNTSQRQQALRGYVYAPFEASFLLAGIFGNETDKTYGFQIYKDTVLSENLIYQSANYESLRRQPNTTAHTSSITVNNQKWALVYQVSDDILTPTLRNRPASVLYGGIFFSALLAGFVFMLILGRTRSIAFSEEHALQQAKDDLLSLASHQLRTPATGVKQYLGMLLEGFAGNIPKKQRGLLKKAYQSNERQLATIDEILHVARVTSGEIKLDLTRVDLKKLIKKIVVENKTSAREKNLTIQLNMPKKPLSVIADETYLAIAVENLVTNAIKYTYEEGTIAITAEKSASTTTIVVHDSGVGIPDSQLHLLFQKFSRLHNELTRQVTGSGVGLYLAREIMRLHGGDITAESAPGKGSDFIITLPNEPPQSSHKTRRS
jgi:signal transduction histidine kinase